MRGSGLTIVPRIVRLKRSWAALCGLVLLAAPTVGSPEGLDRRNDPQAAVVEELVVRGAAAPVWWRVSDADSEVWVLGVPAGLPKAVAWNEAPLKARLKAARAVILPAQARPGVLRTIVFFLGHKRVFKSDRPMETTVPEPLAARFAAARQGLGQPAKRYQGWKPAVAGMLLIADMMKPLKWSTDQPQGRVATLARQAGKSARPVQSFSGGQVLDAMLTISEDAHRDCLADELAQVEAGAGAMTAAAQAWARGDVRSALAAQRGFDRCLAALPAFSALIRRREADTAEAIRGALRQPGETVAVVELRDLLSREGVLDQLRAQGLKVDTPGGA